MILLASGSPRRADLLRLIGAQFKAFPVDLDESPLPGEGPADYVERLAVEKSQAGWLRGANSEEFNLALGADTSVILNGNILGKPLDRDHHCEMMTALAGHYHEVLSAVAVTDGVRTESLVVVTQVKIRAMSAAEIDSYWHTGEPADKAGGYAIQGLGSVFIEAINGSYSSVVGLPLLETASLLTRFSVPYWLTATPGE
jgi:nucleoside triphosphate pyrophosphatase